MMVKDRQILLLFDNLNVKNEIVNYALSLAKRMNAEIIMLLLLKMENDENNGLNSYTHKFQELKSKGEKIMEPFVEMGLQNKINISVCHS